MLYQFVLYQIEYTIYIEIDVLYKAFDLTINDSVVFPVIEQSLDNEIYLDKKNKDNH